MATEWQTVKLGDVAEISTGFPFKSSNYSECQADIRLLRGDNVAQGVLRWEGVKRWPANETATLDNYWLKEDDVILAMDRPWIEAGLKYARIRMNDLPALLVQRVARLRGSNILDIGFLYHIIGSRAFTQYVLAIQTGTAVPHISIGQIKTFEFRLPPLEEQRRISHILGTLDNKIELNRRQIETLESLAQALFQSWFVDFDPVRAKASGAAEVAICQRLELSPQVLALFPAALEESALGEVPAGWEISKLDDLVSVVDYVANGSFASLKQNVTLLDKPGYAIYVRTTDYNSQFSKDMRFVSEDAYNFLSKSALNGTETIISNVGDVGTVFRAPVWLGLPMTLGSNAVALKSKKASNYFFQHFKSHTGQAQIQSLITGSAQLKFNKTSLRALSILMPSESIINEFERISGNLSKQQVNLTTESRALAALRDELLPQLLSGEVSTLPNS